MGGRAQRRTAPHSRAGIDASDSRARACVEAYELTHSFVGQKPHGRAPTWLQRRRRAVDGGTPQQFRGSGLWWMLCGRRPPHRSSDRLDGSRGMGLSEIRPRLRMRSVAVVESIVDAGSVTDISRLLDRLATSSSDRSGPAAQPYISRLCRPSTANPRLPKRTLPPSSLHEAFPQQSDGLCRCLLDGVSIRMREARQ